MQFSALGYLPKLVWTSPGGRVDDGESPYHLHTLCTCFTRDAGPLVRLSHRGGNRSLAGLAAGWMWGVEMGILSPDDMVPDASNEKQVASARALKILIGTPPERLLIFTGITSRRFMASLA